MRVFDSDMKCRQSVSQFVDNRLTSKSVYEKNIVWLHELLSVSESLHADI